MRFAYRIAYGVPCAVILVAVAGTVALLGDRDGVLPEDRLYLSPTPGGQTG